MRKTRKQLAALGLVSVMALGLLSGCSSSGNQPAGDTGTTAVTSSAAEQPGSGTSGETAGQDLTDQEVTAGLAEGGSMTITYVAEDLDDSWDADSAVSIVCDGDQIKVAGEGASADGSTVTISKAGTYVVSGTLSDGQILVDAGKDDVIRLVLNGAELSNSQTAPVYGLQSGKIILTLADGTENRVSDGSEYVYASVEEDEPNAAVFSKDDLVINGTGRLNVDGNYECGIRSKDDLTVISSNITITAKSDGLKGKDSVVIKDGSFIITSGKDGIKSNNDTEADKGYIWIDGGQFLITAADDGIQAETKVVVNGGEITIADSQEGICGLTVDINGGVIDIVSQDDGMNAAATVETEREKMMDQEGVYLRIAGGEITINAMADGLDSNGDLYMEGGTLYMSGPTGGGDGMLDYNGTSLFTGGSIFAAGNSGMMQTFGSDSTQPYLVIYYDSNREAGTALVLTDENGQELLNFTPAKEFNTLIVSVPEMAEGKTCRITGGDEITEVTVTGIETVSGTAQGGRGQGGGFGGGRGQGGERPDGEMPAMPEGERPEGGPPDMEGRSGTNGEMTPPEDAASDGFQPPEGGTPGTGTPEDGRGQGGRGSRELPPEAESTPSE